MDAKQGNLDLFQNNSQRYVIKFDTEKEAIDADVLADALSSYKRTVLSLASGRHDSDRLFVDVDVINKGCVEIHTILTAIQSAINPATIPAIIESIKSLVDLSKFLKGKPVKKATPVKSSSEDSLNQIVITNADNVNVTINNNVYNTYLVSPTPPFGDSRRYAQDKISSVRLLDEDENEYVNIDKSEFACFEKRRPQVKDDDTECQEEELELVVTTVPLGTPRNKWGFVNLGEPGRQIMAKIKDDEFLSKVDQHAITFGKGDWIRAKVTTHKEFNPATNCLEIKSWTVSRVLEYSIGQPTESVPAS